MMNEKRSNWRILTVLCGIAAVVSILGIFAGDMSLSGGEEVIFRDHEGERLRGTLYSSLENNYGILLLEGFGSDQVTLRNAANEFAKNKFTVFTFDFSGHGRSPGGLDFNNAETDRLARQALAGKEEFKRITQIPDDHIIFLGHSLGARVALQAASMDDAPPAGIILLGTQVNLSTNMQSEFFTGVSDKTLGWVQDLGPENPRTNILLISGNWDDILTPAAAEALFKKLSEDELEITQRSGNIQEGSSRELIILDKLVHNYEVFSSRALSHALTWTGELFLSDNGYHISPSASNRIWFWCSGFFSLLLGLIAFNRWYLGNLPVAAGFPKGIIIEDIRKYLWGKLVLTIVAIPIMLLVSGFVFLLPLNKPVFNIYFVGFIGGYGLLMIVLYRVGRMPGISGRIRHIFEGRKPTSWLQMILGLWLGISLLLFTAAYARSGWFHVFPVNERLVWLVIFVPVTALGFWIGSYENHLIKTVEGGKSISKLYIPLIGFFPFFLYSFLLGILGSISGLIGGLQGLLILWLVFTVGTIFNRIWQRPWLSAVFQAILLYWLVLPQGVLFR